MPVSFVDLLPSTVTVLTDRLGCETLASNTCSIRGTSERAPVGDRGAPRRGREGRFRRTARGGLHGARARCPNAGRGAAQEAVGDPPPPVTPAGGLSVDRVVARGPASSGVDGRLEGDPDGAIAREDAAHQGSPGHG